MAGRTARTAVRVMCPAVRYREQRKEDWDIENTLCRQHASVEWGGACCYDHQQQCQKYCPELFPMYEEMMRSRHETPAIADTMASVRLDIGRIIYDVQEVRCGSTLYRPHNDAEGLK